MKANKFNVGDKVYFTGSYNKGTILEGKILQHETTTKYHKYLVDCYSWWAQEKEFSRTHEEAKEKAKLRIKEAIKKIEGNEERADKKRQRDKHYAIEAIERLKMRKHDLEED
jgi:hypothetical protein